MRITDEFVIFSRMSDTFSNMFPSKFTVLGVEFFCVEQYIMYRKALLFSDTKSAQKILREKDSKKLILFGRRIKNYNKSMWRSHREHIAYTGVLAKYLQNLELRKQLLETGDKELVLATPGHLVWGIDMHITDPNIIDKAQWAEGRGANLLGKILVLVRERIKTADKNANRH